MNKKLTFVSWKWSVFFFKEGKSQFFDKTLTEITEIIFSTSCIKFKIFSFILFEKRRLAQDIRRPKAADSFLNKSNLLFYEVWKPLVCQRVPKWLYYKFYRPCWMTTCWIIHGTSCILKGLKYNWKYEAKYTYNFRLYEILCSTVMFGFLCLGTEPTNNPFPKSHTGVLPPGGFHIMEQNFSLTRSGSVKQML